MKPWLTFLFAALLCTATLPAAAYSNPFSDVPADHWSIDAVQQLSADGILQGYPDGSLRGNNNLTRYEMAQIIAKAIASQDTGKLSKNDQLLLDKLSAEYSNELNNLGVRIANLENKSDNVKFTGYMYLRAQSQQIKNKATGTKETSSSSRAFVDLFTTAKVNEHWDAVMETNTNTDLKESSSNAETIVVGSFANGKYNNFATRLGRFDQYSADGGVVLHNTVSGAEFAFGNKLKTVLTAGRMSHYAKSLNSGNAFDYQTLELTYPTSSATKIAGGYYRLSDPAFKLTRGSSTPQIYTLGFRSKVAQNLALTGYYLKSSSDKRNHITVKDTGYYGALEYRTAKLDQPDTWSLYLKYANVPELTQITMDVGHFRDYNGFELGGFYMLAKNIRGHLRYYYGKNVENSKIEKSLIRAEVRMFF